jgi:hypothetical protein
MAYQAVGLGSAADDGTGDSLRAGGTKVNSNFSELYNLLGTGTALVSSITANGDDFTFIGAAYNAVWDKSDNALEFADNAKARFGTGDDLEIYHDGSNSIIKDNGTGNLSLRADDFQLTNSTFAENYITAANNGAVTLYYDNAVKVATTSAGISVTGTVLSSGNIELGTGATVIFEGSSADAYETVLTVVDPTADRTITIPNSTGTLITTGDSNVITSAMIVDGTIVSADIASNSITLAKMADNSVSTNEIINGTIVSADIAAGTIAESNMAADSIGQNQLKTLSTLLIKNSSGSTLKTCHTAGA